MHLWRISNYESLGGEGGLRASARFHTKGRPIVYLAGSAAGAMVETLVHLNGRLDKTPNNYKLLRMEAPEALDVTDLSGALPKQWKDDLTLTRRLGDEWLAGQGSALARIPSAIMPDTSNYLLNPLHRDAATLRIVAVMNERYDARFFQQGTPAL